MNLRDRLHTTGCPNRVASLFVLGLAVLSCTTLAQAQFRASLRGTVTDPQGAAVSGAKVTLTDTDTNQILVSTSDDNGIYQFNALRPAPYKLTVEKAGFQTNVLEHVAIIPEQPNSLDVALEVGQVQQSVTVSGTTYALDTETADISGTVTSNQVQHMPSFGRDVFQLVQLAPGVFGDGAQGANGLGENLPGTQGPGATGGSQGVFQTENGPQAVAGGQQYENNSISIDGISTASAVWGGTTIVTPSEDSIQSVKVLSNDYDAEYGRFSGAQIQVTSLSGTNDFHGTAFFTMHRPGLNAFQRFNGQNNAVLKDRNFFDQTGGGIGGPIWKNKIFFFFAYETARFPKAVTTISNEWGDTSSFDSSAPSGSIAATYLSFPGSAIVNRGINPSTCANAGLQEGVNCRTIPGQGLDIGSPLKTPLGTQDLTWQSTANPGVGSGLDGVADIANYITASQSTSSKDQYNGRLDLNATANDRISFAIYWVPQSSSFLNGPARDYNFFHHSQINQAYSVIWNHIFSPNLLNEFRVNAAGWHWNEVSSNPQAPVGLPTDFIDQEGSLTGSTVISQFGPNIGSILNQWTYGWKDVVTKVVGRHTIKFGADVTRLFYLQDCAGCGVPHYNFFNVWDFLNDAPHVEGSGFSPTTGFPTTLRQDDRQTIWGTFVQDDFKLRRNLTLNLGLRYNYFGSLSSKQGNIFVGVPGAGSAVLTGLNVRLGHSWIPEKDNLSPEVGFAWSPGILHDKLVIRGGYGLNYNQEEIALSSSVNGNPGLVVFPTFSMSTPTSANPGIIYAVSSNVHNIYGYPANPNSISTFGANGLPTTGSVNLELFPRDLPTIRVHHYSVDAQYDLGHSTIASLGYEGSLSRNIVFDETANAVPAARGFTLNPQIGGGGDSWVNSGRGNYNAMLLELKHEFSYQFTADAQFRWAKSLDTSSGPYFKQPYPYDLNLDYGRSDYDVSKAFKLYGVWQPVFFRGERGWMEKIIGGWSVSGILNVHTGFPWSPLVSVVGGDLYCGTCDSYRTLFPASYIAKPGTSTSNDQFKTGSNYPGGGTAFFAMPTYTAFKGSAFGSALPQSPGVHRNSLNGPGYRDLDATLAKAFGFPRIPGLGENAKVEFRADFYNLFNTLNFNPGDISNVITNANFGQDTGGLAGRVITLGIRFSF